MTSRKAKFKPRARLLDILGEQLIRNHKVALFELVKNAYDADSPDVEVVLENLTDPRNARILVRDRGCGMDVDILEGAWLEPAADHKLKAKREKDRTPIYKRLPIGEKGVGRFAVQRLGRKMELVTRMKGKLECVVSVDWESIGDHKYLEDFELEIHEREPEVFRGDDTGTQITVTKLKNLWSRGDVRSLYRMVNTLVSPFDSTDPFEVIFHCPGAESLLDGLFSAEDAEQFALFHFDFMIDDDGIDWVYKFTPTSAMKAEFKTLVPREANQPRDSGFEFFHREPNESGGRESSTTWGKRPQRSQPVSLQRLGIGTIYGRLMVFDLDKDVKRFFQDATGLTDFLKEQGGMKVYRDGIRVYDYGEPGNDWLGLDVRRVQIPAKRLSNNIFLGEVHLDTESSMSLQEKTNREGFVENEAFWEFRYAIVCALAILEAERRKDKDHLRERMKHENEEFPAKDNSPDAAIHALREKVGKEKLYPKLGKYVEKVEKTYKETKETLLNALGSGMGLTLVFHELERGVKGVTNAFEHGVEGERIRQMLDDLVKLMEGAAFLVRSSKKEEVSASRLVKLALFSMGSRFQVHKIELVNGFEGQGNWDFKFSGSRRMLLAALANVLDNAIYWLSNKSDDGDGWKPKVYIGPSNDLGGEAIIIADNGPGFRGDEPHQLIQPFYTRKVEGMGLGLYYCDMATKANNVQLAFPQRVDLNIPEEYSGAIVAFVKQENN